MARETIDLEEQRAVARLRALQSPAWNPGTESLGGPLQQAEQFINNRLLRSNTQWTPHSSALFPYESPVTHTVAVLYEANLPVVTNRLAGVPHPEVEKFLALPQLVYPRFKRHAQHLYGKTNTWHDRRMIFPKIDIPPFPAAFDPQASEQGRYGLEVLWFEPSYGPLPSEVIEQVLTPPIELHNLPENLRFMEMRLKLVDFAVVNDRTSRMLSTLLERGTLSKDERSALETQREQAQRKAIKLATYEDLFPSVPKTLVQAS